MEKQKVDQIITDYLQKIYGFAVKKSYSYDEAEDLCSEITLEVYQSLLKADEVINIEGYVWRISEHTYAKYVATKKRHEGVSIDGMEIPYYDEPSSEDEEVERLRLRREISFLSGARRRIVYLFYYENLTIASIAAQLNIPEGTVKWHLNKAKKELKEGFTMERKIGKLGLCPIEALNFGHSGSLGKNNGPEFYLEDKINLNIVYSVYYQPRTLEEIAEELGMTPVYIEDRVAMLEANGFIVKTKGDKYTTYVNFSAEKYSLELEENKTKLQLKIAETLVEKYVPLVRAAVADVKDVYIPSGNRELFEAAMIFYSVAAKCEIATKCDLSGYYIKPTDGSKYIAFVDVESKCIDPDYKPTLGDLPNYWSCGHMQRCSGKYPVTSWSIDSRLSSRKGHWENNLYTDYDYIYELITGQICDNAANEDKFKRLRSRQFITEDGKPNIMICRGDMADVLNRTPRLDPATKSQFADAALEYAMLEAKNYPPQMQDLVVTWGVRGFIGNKVALMVMDILYANGTFKPLTEQEKVTSNLIMFSDKLPE